MSGRRRKCCWDTREGSLISAPSGVPTNVNFFPLINLRSVLESMCGVWRCASPIPLTYELDLEAICLWLTPRSSVVPAVHQSSSVMRPLGRTLYAKLSLRLIQSTLNLRAHLSDSATSRLNGLPDHVNCRVIQRSSGSLVELITTAR